MLEYISYSKICIFKKWKQYKVRPHCLLCGLMSPHKSDYRFINGECICLICF